MSESQQGPDICDVISAKRYWVAYCCDHLFQKLSANFWRFLQEWRRFFREELLSTSSDFKVTDWKDGPMIVSTGVSGSGSLVSSLQCVKGRLFIVPRLLKCCPHFFFSQNRFSKSLFQGCLHWLHKSLIKFPTSGVRRANGLPTIPLPWTLS